MGMKRVLKRTLKIIATVLVALVVIYLYAIGSLDNEPHGTFASYGFFPHHVSDVLRFERGKVTLETCCGMRTTAHTNRTRMAGGSGSASIKCVRQIAPNGV